MVRQARKLSAGRHRSSARLFVVVLLALAGLTYLLARPTAAQDYDEAVRRCMELLPGFDEAPQNVQHELQPGNQDQPTGVRLSWQRKEPKAGRSEGWIICWFLPLQETAGAWQINAVDSDEFGALKRYDVQQLYKFLRLRETYPLQPAPPPVAKPLEIRLLYLLQQSINGLTLGCLYALIAVGYTLVYGITRVINFAFGEIYMLGAFLMFCGYALSVGLGVGLVPLALMLVLLATVVMTAAFGWSSDRLVFSRMRGAAPTVPLIAAIGLSISLREGVRLLQGPKARWMPFHPDSSWRIIDGLGFDVYLRKGHLVVGAATLLVAFLLWWMSYRTPFGRNYRACAQDPKMAALLGVNVDRTIAASFLIGGGLTGAAGLFAALQYGIVDFYMGYLVGFKALTAALLGGIGSLPGAILGGMLIALTETFTAGFIGSDWKDIAVFAVLVMVLIFRPGGLVSTLRSVPADERV
jgi:branched-chain amino acid transport system permease protein